MTGEQWQAHLVGGPADGIEMEVGKEALTIEIPGLWENWMQMAVYELESSADDVAVYGFVEYRSW